MILAYIGVVDGNGIPRQRSLNEEYRAALTNATTPVSIS
jgi:hypothetical protein